jgi:EF-hand domain pair
MTNVVNISQHDVDNNGFWDEMEVKALFKTELDKVYQQGLPEDDMRERAEEMERMREHVYKEADVNHDRLISFEEFMAQTQRKEYQQDPGWDTVSLSIFTQVRALLKQTCSRRRSINNLSILTTSISSLSDEDRRRSSG